MNASWYNIIVISKEFSIDYGWICLIITGFQSEESYWNDFVTFLRIHYIEIIIFRVLAEKMLFDEIWVIYLKTAIFTAYTLNMSILSSSRYSQRNAVSIPAWKKIYLKIFSWWKTPFIWLLTKKNLHKNSENGLLLIPKGHFGLNYQSRDSQIFEVFLNNSERYLIDGYVLKSRLSN